MCFCFEYLFVILKDSLLLYYVPGRLHCVTVCRFYYCCVIFLLFLYFFYEFYVICVISGAAIYAGGTLELFKKKITFIFASSLNVALDVDALYLY